MSCGLYENYILMWSLRGECLFKLLRVHSITIISIKLNQLNALIIESEDIKFKLISERKWRH